MSRHRTTKKMRRVSDQEGESKLAQTEVDTCVSSEPGPETSPTEDVAARDEALTAESLGRYLATEAALREESEQRTSAVLTRYLRLTLVMACLNVVVAGASVVALLGNRKAPPVVIAPPVVPAPAPAALPPPAPPTPVVVQPAVPPAEPPAPAPAPPARVPLLGPLLAPTPKHAPAAAATRGTRVASKPAPSPAPVALARNADDEDAPSVHHSVERW